MDRAKAAIGTPYCNAGRTSDCYDCSGFVYDIFQKAGIALPRRSEEQFLQGSPVSTSSLSAADLVFFRTTGKSISHVGIYIGDYKFIHSATSKGVLYSSLNDSYWKARYAGARRVLK